MGEHRAAGRVGRGVGPSLRSGDANGAAVAVARHQQRRAGGPDHEIGSRVAGLRAGLAEGGDRGIDDLRRALGDLLVAEAELGHAADVAGFEDEIGGLDQAAGEFAPAGMAEIAGDSALAAGVGGPEDRAFVAGAGLAEEWGKAAAAGAGRRLDLNHVGTEVGEYLPGEDAALVAEVDHAVGSEHRRRLPPPALSSSAGDRRRAGRRRPARLGGTPRRPRRTIRARCRGSGCAG